MERKWTEAADVRALIAVQTFVGGLNEEASELLVAHLAFVGFFSGMFAPVVLQPRLLVEHLGAVGPAAYENSLSRVNLRMLLERRFVTEGIFTLPAFERAFLAVNSFVAFQTRFVGEGFMAGGAFDSGLDWRLQTEVDVLVFNQISLITEDLFAGFASVNLFPAVTTLVLLSVAGRSESPVAELAAERSRACVNSFMLIQTGPGFKTFLTNFAFEVSDLAVNYRVFD